MSDAVVKLAQSLDALSDAIDRRNAERARIAHILRTFYVAPISASSLQPILDLAVELNPDLPTQKDYRA